MMKVLKITLTPALGTMLVSCQSNSDIKQILSKPDSRINLIRVSIPNPGNLLKPGMPAYVLLKSPRRKTLTLPIDAVIRDGKGQQYGYRRRVKHLKV